MRTHLKLAILTTWGTQTRFARAIGKRDDWVSQIVTGRKNPSVNEKALIVSHLEKKYSNNSGLFFDEGDSLKRLPPPGIKNGNQEAYHFNEALKENGRIITNPNVNNVNWKAFYRLCRFTGVRLERRSGQRFPNCARSHEHSSWIKKR